MRKGRGDEDGQRGVGGGGGGGGCFGRGAARGGDEVGVEFVVVRGGVGGWR